MFCTTTSISRALLLLILGVAGSFADPAFFLRSGFYYSGLYSKSQFSVSSWNSHLETGWHDSSSALSLKVQDWNLSIRSSSFNASTPEGPLASFAYEWEGLGLTAGGANKSSPFWGISAKHSWHEIDTKVLFCNAKRTWLTWNASSSSFPDSKHRIFGSYLDKANTLALGVGTRKPSWGIEGDVLGKQTSPRNGQSEYALTDSSLWLVGHISGFLDLGPLSLHSSIESQSGNYKLKFLRNDDAGNRLVASGKSGWDNNSLQIIFAGRGVRHDLGYSPDSFLFSTPFQWITLPRLTPTHESISLKLSIQQLTAHEFEPPRDGQTENFYANRLFSPQLEDLYGFSFYRYNLSAWGKGKLNVYHSEITLPLHTRHFTPWAAAGFEYWNAKTEGSARRRVAQIILEEEDFWNGNAEANIALGIFGLGALFQLPSSHVQIQLGAQQIVPFWLRIEYNEHRLNSPGNTASSGVSTIFRNGFESGISIQWLFG